MELNTLREEYKKLKLKKAAIRKKSTGNEANVVAQALSSDSEEE